MDNVTRLLMQGAAGAGSKTYVDDVFSTYLYDGTAGSQSINNGIDLSGEGGMTWIKTRTQNFEPVLFDTARGAQKVIRSDVTTGELTYADGLTSFNNNGFTLGADTSRGCVNQDGSGWDYLSWSFRKQKGFFDIVTYTGNGVAGREIAHSLGSVPGCIMVKNISDSYEWAVYHKSLGGTKNLQLSANGAAMTNQYFWNNTNPTATHFTTGLSTDTNKNGDNYVAYIFAGGESTAATAVSVDFDGSSDYLSIADSSDFTLGSGDFTFEAWIKIDALNPNGAGWLTDWNNGALGWFFGTTVIGGAGTNRFIFGWSDTGSNINTIDSGHTVKADGQFHHYSVTRSGTTLYFFLDGNLIKTNAGVTESFNNPSGAIAIGQNPDVGGTDWLLDGKISNLRLVKGTCLYTTSFRPPTEPLTSITNTVLLCCNNSSVTGSTVTPSTITSVGSPTASTDSPFDDPAGFNFGEGGDQNLIKTGSYLGNGSTTAREIYLGWEPQWILVKCAENTESWVLFDSMRGIVTGGNDFFVEPNDNGAENTFQNWIELTPTGFKIITGNHQVNQNNKTYIYTCIRRPDGYVGKPAEVGTDVFAMDYGNSSSIIPTFDSGFPVDFGFYRIPTQAQDFTEGARLTGIKYLLTNAANNEADNSYHLWDSNVGWSKGHSNSYLSWMWKRHAGFDVVTYTGLGGTLAGYAHNLNKIPEMMWVKRRDSTNPWSVYHKGLNAGNSPEGYGIQLNTSNAEASSTTRWASTAPTSTHFFAGGNTGTNNADSTYIAMLFASVAGISKVGYYDGTGSGLTITTGFSPRFVILKRIDASGNWYVLDTTRGWGSGNDKHIQLNETNADSDFDFGAPTATGFTLTVHNGYNGSGGKYIYYAHA